jgi:hypothetical protein
MARFGGMIRHRCRAAAAALALAAPAMLPVTAAEPPHLHLLATGGTISGGDPPRQADTDGPRERVMLTRRPAARVTIAASRVEPRVDLITLAAGSAGT